MEGLGKLDNAFSTTLTSNQEESTPSKNQLDNSRIRRFSVKHLQRQVGNFPAFDYQRVATVIFIVIGTGTGWSYRLQVIDTFAGLLGIFGAGKSNSVEWAEKIIDNQHIFVGVSAVSQQSGNKTGIVFPEDD